MTVGSDRKKTEAFEMWKMEKINRLDKVANEEVSQKSKGREENAELYLAKETSMDWPCFETRWTFA